MADHDDGYDERPDTPLHEAAEAGFHTALRLLLEAGADVNAQAAHGATPLHRAVGNNHVVIVRALIKAGADVNAGHSLGMTALHDAARSGYGAVLQALLEAGADARAKSTFHLTPLHCAAKGGHADVVRVLIDAGADVHAVGGFGGDQPIHEAAYGGHLAAAQVLLDAGASVLTTNVRQVTPVHGAAGQDMAPGAPLLCNLLSRMPEGTYLDDMVDSDGCTPMHWACCKGASSVTVSRALLARGATSDAVKDNAGHTAADDARFYGKQDVLDLFERHAERPFDIDDVPEAFTPLLTENPLWKVDTMVAMWGTRKWGSGAPVAPGAAYERGYEAGLAAARTTLLGARGSRAGDDAGAGARPLRANIGAATQVAPASATVDDGAPGDDAEPQLAPAPYNVGLPQKIVLWQSMPRNVVAIVAELSVDLLA